MPCGRWERGGSYLIRVEAVLVNSRLVARETTEVFEKHNGILHRINCFTKRIKRWHWSFDDEGDCEPELMLQAVMAMEPVTPDVVMLKFVPTMKEPPIMSNFWSARSLSQNAGNTVVQVSV